MNNKLKFASLTLCAGLLTSGMAMANGNPTTSKTFSASRYVRIIPIASNMVGDDPCPLVSSSPAYPSEVCVYNISGQTVFVSTLGFGNFAVTSTITPPYNSAGAFGDNSPNQIYVQIINSNNQEIFNQPVSDYASIEIDPNLKIKLISHSKPNK